MSEQASKEEKRRLFAQLEELKKELRDLRNNLTSVNQEKENYFSQKDIVSTKIRTALTAIKQERMQRDEFTKKVKELKDQRNTWNKKVQDHITVFKRLDSDKQKAIKEKRRSPDQLKEEIASLETRLETDVMSFEKEKEMTKKVKDLKKELAGIIDIGAVRDGMKTVNKSITESKKESEVAHQEIQKVAQESQQLHESILAKSKEVDELKPKEKELLEKCNEFKAKFKVLNDQFKAKITEINALQEQLKEYRLEDSEKKKLDDTKILKEKEMELEEKIKMGKKLTTDDFYIFQHSKDMKRE